MNPGRHTHIVDIGLLLEIEVNALNVLDFQIAFPERRRVDAIAEDGAGADSPANALQAFERKPQPVLVRSAPTVVALIVERRQKLPRQIAVAEVQFDAVQARGDRAPAGFRKALQHVFDLVLLDLLRRRSARHFTYRHLARPEHVGIVFVGVARRIGLQKRRGRSQTDMQQLRDDRTVMLFDRSRHARKPFDLLFVPKAGKGGGRIEGVLVDEMSAKDDHSDSGLGALFVIRDGLLGEDALVCASHPGGADRSEDHPIGNLGVANLPGRKQTGIRASTRHGDSLH